MINESIHSINTKTKFADSWHAGNVNELWEYLIKQVK